jgi:hypothetical protein
VVLFIAKQRLLPLHIGVILRSDGEYRMLFTLFCFEGPVPRQFMSHLNLSPLVSGLTTFGLFICTYTFFSLSLCEYLFYLCPVFQELNQGVKECCVYFNMNFKFLKPECFNLL